MLFNKNFALLKKCCKSKYVNLTPPKVVPSFVKENTPLEVTFMNCAEIGANLIAENGGTDEEIVGIHQ